MDTGNEFPYPVLAVGDLANNYSPEHCRFAVGHCRDLIAKIIAEDNRSDQQIARVRILEYLDLQLSRAVRWIEEDADLMAGVMRSLIELKCWAHFISMSSKRVTQFLNEASINARELYERLEKLVPPDTYQLETPLIQGKRVPVAPSGAQESPARKRHGG
jgi:malonyl CoA-acyl carrier protein transacylase